MGQGGHDHYDVRVRVLRQFHFDTRRVYFPHISSTSSLRPPPDARPTKPTSQHAGQHQPRPQHDVAPRPTALPRQSRAVRRAEEAAARAVSASRASWLLFLRVRPFRLTIAWPFLPTPPRRGCGKNTRARDNVQRGARPYLRLLRGSGPRKSGAWRGAP